MLQLQYRHITKLNTTRVVFEDVIRAQDSASLEQLRELSAKRRAIEESINKTSSVPDSIAREMSGGVTSHSQQDLQKLEQYLPLLENLALHVDSLGEGPSIHKLISDLKIRWTSSLSASTFLKQKGPKFFQIDCLQFELTMTLFLYGAVLRERAFEVLAEDLMQCCTLLRRSSGVYSYLACEILPSLQPKLPPERPPEAITSVSAAWSLICLAEAQSVTIKKAEEKRGSPGLLSKLHCGVSQLLDEASETLQALLHNGGGGHKDISTHLLDYVSSSRELHELRSYKCLAEDRNLGEQAGIAIGLLREVLKNVEKKAPKSRSWQQLFKQEVDGISKMLKKYEEENAFGWRQKIPLEHELPLPEAKNVVNPIPYEHQRWERELAFIIA
ncbi:hypothetical protein Dimus_014737 [Dionaea muscipula]